MWREAAAARMLRSWLTLASLAAAIAVPHHGAYADPNHYKEGSFAGMRYIAEINDHVLVMNGSDDGVYWWTLFGKCSGEGMGTITFDFSAKGGPKDLTGQVVYQDDGSDGIKWPDGNIWVRIDKPDT